MSAEPLPRPPPIVRVLWAPRETFAGVMAARRGYGTVFAIMAIAFVLVDPIDITTHLMRLTFAPVASIIGLWSAYLRYALPAGVAVFAVGIAFYYALRLGRRPRLDVWTAASLAAYAWLPHVLLVAAGVIVAALGFAHPILPQVPFEDSPLGPAGLVAKALVAYGASAALFAVGARVAWHGEAGVTIAAPPGRHGRAVTAAAGLLVVVALGFTVERVVARWDEARPPMPGDTLSAFSLPQLDGPALDSASLAGSVILIDFWATWCPPCVASMPHVEALHQEYTARGFKLVSVNTEPDAAPAVRAFVREHRLTFPIFVDSGTLQRRLRVQSLPTALLVDAQGRVREVYVGAPSPARMRREIERLLGERDAS